MRKIDRKDSPRSFDPVNCLKMEGLIYFSRENHQGFFLFVFFKKADFCILQTKDKSFTSPTLFV